MNVLATNTVWIHDEEGISIDTILRSMGMRIVDAQKLDQKLDRIDVIVIGGELDARARYLTALASTEKKSILWFAQSKALQKEIANELQNMSFVQVVLFDATELRVELKRFFSAHVIIDEKPSIKFTLRITPSVDKYLQWKSSKTGLSKADFLRESIQKLLIDKDDEYKKQ